jgi:hypothetical protein
LRRQPSLRAQLNQIRLWVRQGRTDAWIAHKLDIGVDELTRFKREHQLDDDAVSPLRPADPLSVPAPEPAAEEPDEEDEDEPVEEDEDRPSRREREGSRRRSRPPRRPREPRAERDEQPRAPRPPREPRPPRDDEGDEEMDGEPRRRRRRGRRGGRRHRGRRNAFEATFDHGEEEGYGLWLDPAVVDNPVYSEHWAGHRAVTVTVEADAITIRRAEADRPPEDDDEVEPED